MSRRNIPTPTMSASDIGTPQPILEWWPVKLALKIVRKIFTYQIRSYFHKIMYPVRIILFLSGWPLVYFLRFLKFTSLCIYRGATYMLGRIEEREEAKRANANNVDDTSYTRPRPTPSAPPYPNEDFNPSSKRYS